MTATPSEDRDRSLSRSGARWEARDWAPLVSLAVLLLFFTFAAPGFLRPATWTMILSQGAVLAVVSVGLTFVLLCGEIDLAVGMTAVWSACCCGWMYEHWVLEAGDTSNLALMVAVVILLPLASCLEIGLLSGALTIWSRLPSFIITLAMMFIAEGLAKYLTKGARHAMPPILQTIGNEGIPLLGRHELPYSALLAVAIFLAAHFLLRYTRFGRYVYATGGNRQAARLAGIRTGRVVLICMAICALTAGLGGLINAGRMGDVTLDQNKDLLLSAVACVVLGGTSLFGGEGSIGKTAVGVLTFTVLSVGLNKIDWIDDLARQALTGVVLLVALIINGLLAKSHRAMW